MKIASLLACLILACTMSAAPRAQATKPELQLLDFNTLDTNHDGKLSPLEARADPELSMDFDALDVNHDGYLSMEEFQAWPRAKKAKAPDPSTAPGGSSGAQHLPRH
jgi:Ca2+-binding EF-hand superfamily protein